MAPGSARGAQAGAVVNALSVDVEDYFQVSAFEAVVARERWPEYESRVAANTDRVLGVFAEAGVRATFFVLGWVAERDPSIVRRIAGAGHEVASHGFGHRLVYDQSPEEFREDVRRGKAVVEAASGQRVRGYRAPSFSITERSLWALDVLAEEGFAYDASIFPIRHDRYGIPSAPRHPFRVTDSSIGRVAGDRRSQQDIDAVAYDQRSQQGSDAVAYDQRSQQGSDAVAYDQRSQQGFSPVLQHSLLEIPSSTIRFAGQNLPIGGGGYFRLLPYWWTRFGIRRLNESEGKPAVFYLHPWELDPAQPRLAASRLSRFRHYRNLAKTEGRLRRLLNDFRFGPIADTIVDRASSPEP